MLSLMRRQEAVTVGAEKDLVERARGGERRAFDALVEKHLPRVWQVVWRILRHHEDTEDVVQEVFLAAHRALPDFRGNARFSTWLHRIAVNRALNHRSLSSERVRRESQPLDLFIPGPNPGGNRFLADLAHPEAASPLEELEMEELKRKMAECMKRMPPVWRAVLSLRLGESLPYEEISRVLGTALGTVRSRLARARLALRRCVLEEST